MHDVGVVDLGAGGGRPRDGLARLELDLPIVAEPRVRFAHQVAAKDEEMLCLVLLVHGQQTRRNHSPPTRLHD